MTSPIHLHFIEDLWIPNRSRFRKTLETIGSPLSKRDGKYLRFEEKVSLPGAKIHGVHKQKWWKIERGGKRDNGKVCVASLASSAIDSNRKIVSLRIHFPATGASRGQEQMHTAATLTRCMLRNPRNWTTISDRQRLYRCIPIYIYILPRPHAHKSLLCDPRNSHVSILTPPHFRRSTNGKISSFIVVIGSYCGSDYRPIESYASRHFLLLFLL